MTFICGHHLLYALLEGLADIDDMCGVDLGPVMHYEGLEIVESVVTAVAALPQLVSSEKVVQGVVRIAQSCS